MLLRLSRRLSEVKWPSEIIALARRLDEAAPDKDPASLKLAAIKSLANSLPLPQALDREIDFAQVQKAWNEMFLKRMHDSAYEDMADPGELCDGELPSWRDARLRVEADPKADVPSVSAHEAATKLRKKK
jgi:hypothetical protein